MKLKPLADRVVVQPKEVEEKTPSGLIIPDSSKESPQEGVVVAVGKGIVEIEMEVKVGDKIMYGKYAGTEISYKGEQYLIMRESDIMAIL